MKIFLITGLVAFVIGLGSGWAIQGWKRDSADKQRIEKEAEKKEEHRKQANKASAGFEEKRTANEIRYRTVTVTVEKVVERPVYLNQCLDDDGLHILNDQILRRANPGEPGIKLPKS